MFDEALGGIGGSLGREGDSARGTAERRMFPCQHQNLCLAGHGDAKKLSAEWSSAEQVASLGAADLVGPQRRLAVQHNLLRVEMSEWNGVEVVGVFCVG